MDGNDFVFVAIALNRIGIKSANETRAEHSDVHGVVVG
jgi:hypothetical protein